MRITLYLEALWRFRRVVVVGVVLAVALALLSSYKISFDGGRPAFAPRQSETWSSQATIFVTQDGFPWGRTYLLSKVTIKGAAPTALGEPGRFQSLAVLYTELANSDQVKEIMQRSGPVDATLEAVAVVPPVDSPPLPLIRLAATSDTAEGAVAVGRRYTDAFREFIGRQQQRAGIPDDQRVKLEVTRAATTAELIAGRSKTLPMLVFITVLCAVAGFVFILENLRQSRARALTLAPEPTLVPMRPYDGPHAAPHASDRAG